MKREERIKLKIEWEKYKLSQITYLKLGIGFAMIFGFMVPVLALVDGPKRVLLTIVIMIIAFYFILSYYHFTSHTHNKIEGLYNKLLK